MSSLTTRAMRMVRWPPANPVAAFGVETEMIQADVSVDADCRRLAQAAIDRWGRIDALVNNAGNHQVLQPC